MSFLDGLIGGVAGSAMTSFVGGFVERHGGVQGIVTQMEKQGLGATVQSWVGTGQNQPVSPDQVHQAFGPGVINEMAAKAGVDPQVVLQTLAKLLPSVIDQLTPGGTIPAR